LQTKIQATKENIFAESVNITASICNLLYGKSIANTLSSANNLRQQNFLNTWTMEG